MPQRKFNFYSIGYETPIIKKYNDDRGSPVNIIGTVDPEVMPAEYKKHQWLVYTADRNLTLLDGLWP